jgi:hypothetical protein
MAVRAAYFALVDLRGDRGPCATAMHHQADIRHLVADVIEVQHADVGLAAIDAWMELEIAADQQAAPVQRSKLPALTVRDLSLLVPRVPVSGPFALT